MLNQKIRETIQAFRTSLPPELSALIEQGAGEISALDIVERALRPGDRAPDFELGDRTGRRHRLADYLAKGPLVVTFYRGVWCPFCNLQLKAYEERLDEITALGAGVVALTPEEPGAYDIMESAGAPAEVLGMAVRSVRFDVLQDRGSAVARRFGLVFELPESHRKLLSMLNIDIEAVNGDAGFTFPDPATYIVRSDGTIAWAFVPNNYRKRAEVDAILDALRVLRSQAAQTGRTS